MRTIWILSRRWSAPAPLQLAIAPPRLVIAPPRLVIASTARAESCWATRTGQNERERGIGYGWGVRTPGGGMMRMDKHMEKSREGWRVEDEELTFRH
ncbi:hypothetical protein B0H17DRAFT_1332272, partial [Mycena rosella]